MATIRFTNEMIVGALKEMNGMVILASKRIGCNPQTIYNRAKVSPIIQQTINDCRAEFIDIAEQKLKQALINGEPWAISLTLKTIGKDRGYNERTESALTEVMRIVIEEE